jgi:hypothetical protein
MTGGKTSVQRLSFPWAYIRIEHIHAQIHRYADINHAQVAIQLMKCNASVIGYVCTCMWIDACMGHLASCGIHDICDSRDTCPQKLLDPVPQSLLTNSVCEHMHSHIRIYCMQVCTHTLHVYDTLYHVYTLWAFSLRNGVLLPSKRASVCMHTKVSLWTHICCGSGFWYFINFEEWRRGVRWGDMTWHHAPAFGLDDHLFRSWPLDCAVHAYAHFAWWFAGETVAAVHVCAMRVYEYVRTCICTRNG